MKFWKTVKLLNHVQVSIPVLHAEGVSAVTDREKADMLNNYFAKCWNLSKPPLSETCYDDIASTDDDNNLLFCSNEEIEFFLDTSKATGPDNISAHMLIGTATSIGPSLTKLFTLSISKGHLIFYTYGRMLEWCQLLHPVIDLSLFYQYPVKYL